MADIVQITIIGKDQASTSLRTVRGEVLDLGSASSKSGGLLSKLGSSIASLGMMAVKVAAVAAAGAIIGFGAALKGGIDDARAHAQVMAQTRQTIDSMGNAAGVSAEHVEDLAASLSAAKGKSLFGDDQIQAATNMLLTFGNIKGATLDLATALTVDMAQALKKTPEDMSIMIGKLLNSADAMSAAQRMGVSFSDEQIKLGKRLFETGHIAEYQALVMGELNKEFGGQAAAAAKADGGWAQFHDRLGEAAETMGTAVLPLLNGLASVLNDSVLPVVEAATGRFADLIAAFQTGAEGGDILGGLTNALYSLGDVSPIFDDIGDGLAIIGGLLDDTFGEGGGIGVLVGDIREMSGIDLSPVVATVQGLVDTFTEAQDPITGFLDVLSEISPGFALLRGVAEETLPQIQALVESVFGDTAAYLQENGTGMLAEAQATWQSIHDTVLSLVEPIGRVVNAVLEQIRIFWEANGEDILAFASSTWTEINGIIQSAMELIRLTIVPALNFIAQFISDHGTEIQAVLSVVWENIKAIIDIALAIIGGIIRTAVAALKGDWSGAWEEIKGTVDRVWGDIKTIIENTLKPIEAAIAGAWENIKSGVSTTWDEIKSTVSTKLGELETTIKGLPAKLIGVGAAIVNEVWDGLKRRWDEFMADLRAKLQGVRDMLPFSEPKDTSSPLYGLSKAGESIIEQILTGLHARGGDLAGALGDDLDTVQKELRATLTGVGKETYDTTDAFRELLQSLGLTWEQTNVADEALRNLGDTLQDAGPGSDEAADALDNLMSQLGLSGEAAETLRGQITQLAGVTADSASRIAESGREISEAMIDDMARQFERSDLPDVAEELGDNIFGGLLDGMENRFNDVMDHMQEWGERMQQQIEDQWDIHSPSGVTEEFGNNILLGLLQGMESMIPDLLSQIGSLSDDLLSEIERLGEGVQEALAGAFDAEASIDRQMAKNIDAIDKLAGNLRGRVQDDLNAALSEAQEFQDPEQAAKYFKMRSNQILELANLEEKRQQAQREGNTYYADELAQQMELISKAQTAEQAAFRQRAQGGSQIGQLADQLQELLLNEDLPGALNDPSGLVQQLFNWLQQLRNLGNPPPAPQIPEQQPTPTGQGFMGGNTAPIFGQGAIVIHQAPGQSADQLADIIIEKVRQRTGGRLG